MKKAVVVLVLTLMALAMFGCGGTAEQTSGSSYNRNASSYK